LNTLLQTHSTSSRVESSLNYSAIDESDLVRRLRDQISRLNKDIAGLHSMAALVKRKCEIATAVEQHALDRLRVATESLSCKRSIFFALTLFLKMILG
jgi:LPS O-antigen subunit length determinant protein (WzzB/FepE family)